MKGIFYFIERRAAFGRGESLAAFDGFMYHGAVSPWSPLDDNELGGELGSGLVLMKVNLNPFFDFPHSWGAVPPVEISESALYNFAKNCPASISPADGLYFEVCTPIHRPGRLSSFKVSVPSAIFDNSDIDVDLEADILKDYSISWSRNGVVLANHLYEKIVQYIDLRFFNVVGFDA